MSEENQALQRQLLLKNGRDLEKWRVLILHHTSLFISTSPPVKSSEARYSLMIFDFVISILMNCILVYGFTAYGENKLWRAS